MEDSKVLIEAGMEKQAGAESAAQSQSSGKESDKNSDMREWLLASLPARMPLAEKAAIFTRLVEEKLMLSLLKRLSRDELKDLGLCVGHRMVLWEALPQGRRHNEPIIVQEIQSGACKFDKHQGS
jgi:hypothetical protein